MTHQRHLQKQQLQRRQRLRQRMQEAAKVPNDVRRSEGVTGSVEAALHRTIPKQVRNVVLIKRL